MVRSGFSSRGVIIVRLVEVPHPVVVGGKKALSNAAALSLSSSISIPFSINIGILPNADSPGLRYRAAF